MSLRANAKAPTARCYRVPVGANSSRVTPATKKNPRRRTAGGDQSHTSIKRSGQEVAVSANADHPVAGVVRQGGGAAEGRRSTQESSRGVERSAVQVLVEHFHAQVERLGHVPLGARADAPHGPVVVATGAGHGSRAER